MIKKLLLFLVPLLTFVACHRTEESLMLKGKYSYDALMELRGFQEMRSEILRRSDLSTDSFVAMSTDSAWSMSEVDCEKLKQVRSAVARPTTNTLLQKVIPLDDVSIYMNNLYGGTVGGFVCTAADTKGLNNLYNVYWGLRLDYKGTKFRPNGAGYAVIRFRSVLADRLTITYCHKMGGTTTGEWPWTGGGFTSSKLGNGGFPEYTFAAYNAPESGAELYEVIPSGIEILRARFLSGRWQTNETMISKTEPEGQPIRNGVFTDTESKAGKMIITTRAHYRGHEFIVRGLVDGSYHLTTTSYDTACELGLQCVEKGIYGINVPVDQVTDLHETSETL